MRGMLERVSPVLIAAVLAGGFVVASTLPASAEGRHERRDRLHSERPTAAPIETAPFAHPDLAIQIAEAEASEHAAFATYLAAIDAWWAEAIESQRLAQLQSQRRVSVGTGGSGTSGSGTSGGGCNGDVACFLECTRAHESDTSGGYGAVSGSGTYRGAYQFNQNTWDAAVSGAGHDEYAGVPADQVPSDVQDAAAAHLYSVSGTRPWGGRC